MKLLKHSVPVLVIIVILSVLSTLVTVNAQSWEQKPPLPLHQCVKHSPWGFADTRIPVVSLCRTGYLSVYDYNAKIPLYVTYTLKPQNALGCQLRGNDFVTDRSVLNSAQPDDYTNTGYDRGHMAPDSDLAYSIVTQRESYLMTNVTPQAGSLNRGIWKLLETTVRGWVVQQNTTYTIYSGSVYTPQDKKIGRNVVVPSTYYKIVVNHKSNQVAGWLFPHVTPYPNLGNDLTKFRVPVKDIMSYSGVNFKFPNNIVELQPNKEWPVDFGSLTDSKRNVCKK